MIKSYPTQKHKAPGLAVKRWCHSLHLISQLQYIFWLKLSYQRVMPKKWLEVFSPSRRPKATLFTFSFTYIGVSVCRNFVLLPGMYSFFLPVSLAIPLNYIALFWLKTSELYKLYSEHSHTVTSWRWMIVQIQHNLWMQKLVLTSGLCHAAQAPVPKGHATMNS